MERRVIDLFIILKPGLEDSLKLPFERVRHIVNGGHVIGIVTLVLDQHPHDPSDCGAYTGIIIHHEARGHRFGKVAYIAVLEYILLGHSTTLRNGNLGGLGLPNVHIETVEANKAFIKPMEQLHPKSHPTQSYTRSWTRLSYEGPMCELDSYEARMARGEKTHNSGLDAGR